jgi:positive regulator of sigma E activity
MGSNQINHTGTVIKIDNKSIEVMILAQSACSACHSKSMCSLSEMKEKTILIPMPKEKFEQGEQVSVVMAESLGILAVFYAYILPIIVLVATMAGLTLAGISEPVIGACVLILLTAYFFLIYALRNKLNKKFTFKIEKI